MSDTVFDVGGSGRPEPVSREVAVYILAAAHHHGASVPTTIDDVRALCATAIRNHGATATIGDRLVPDRSDAEQARWQRSVNWADRHLRSVLGAQPAP